MRKSPNNQTEQAFAAYLVQIQAGTVLATVNIYANQSGQFILTQTGFNLDNTTITPPSIIFGGNEMEQLGYDSGEYEGKLVARIETQIDDEENVIGVDTHHCRVEALKDILENFLPLQAALNKPASGTDQRLIQEFCLSALVYEDERQMLLNRTQATELTYYVAVSNHD